MAKHLARLNIELLEARCTPAGNVIVTTDGSDNLIITGDSASNRIVIEGLGTTTVLVRGESNTRINGGTDPYSAYINNPRGGNIRVNLGAGSDTIIWRGIDPGLAPGDVSMSFSGTSSSAINTVIFENRPGVVNVCRFAGNVSINVSGNERLRVQVPVSATGQQVANEVEFTQNLTIASANGNDSVDFDANVTVLGDFTWSAGNGANRLNAVNFRVNGNVTITSASGSDTFLFTSLQWNASSGASTSFRTGGGSDTIGLFGPNSIIHGPLSIDTSGSGTSDADVVAFIEVDTSPSTTVSIAMGNDSDTLIFAGTRGVAFRNRVQVDMGAGRDRVDIRQAVFSGAIQVLLGADNDSMSVFNSRFGPGSSINAGANTDRLLRDRTTPSNVYSGFENVRVV